MRKKKHSGSKTSRANPDTPPAQTPVAAWPSQRAVILWGAGLILLGILAYANSFDASFHLDDERSILNNPGIHHIKRLWNPAHGITAFPPRYIALLSFALNHFFHGTDVFGYHAVNLLIHLVSALAVWGIGCLLLKTPRLKDTPVAHNETRVLVPFLAALIFTAHPVNTQAVTYIVQRFESMAAMFYLLALWSFLKARLATRAGHRTFFFAGALVAAVCGMLSKEILITFPVMIVLVEFLFFRPGTGTGQKFPWPLILTTGGLLLCIPAIFHFKVSALFQPVVSGCQENEIIAPLEYMMTELRVLVTFLRLIVLPIHQTLSYDFPKSTGLLDPPTTLFSLVFLAGLAWISFRERKKDLFFSFGIWWFFLILSINFIPRRYVIFEHKLYLPAVGIYWSLLILLFRNLRHIRIKTMAVILISLILAAMTFARNNVWKTEATLWADEVKRSPNRYQPHLNLGLARIKQGREDEALQEFNRAIEILPTGFLAYNNRGVIHFRRGDLDKAIADYDTAIALRPQEPEAYANRGIAYAAKGEFRKARKDFDKTLTILPFDPRVPLLKADLFKKIKKDKKALKSYARAIRLSPRNPEAYRRRAEFYRTRRDFPHAARDYDQAIHLAPNNALCHLGRANLFRDMGRPAMAMADYQKARDLAPDLAEAHLNMADILADQGRGQDALASYARVQALVPQFIPAYTKQAAIYERMGDLTNARQTLQKALTLAPDDILANNALAQIHLAAGEQKKYDELTSDMRRRKIPILHGTARTGK